MKIAVTYGEDGLIYQHFGHSEKFKLYSVEDNEIVSDEIIDAAGSGHDALAGFLKSLGADYLICGGIGAGATAALSEAGIDVYAGISGLPDAAAEALLRGILYRSSEPNCSHHHEDGESCHCHCHEDDDCDCGADCGGEDCGCGCE